MEEVARTKSLTVWALKDNKAGHTAQARGIAAALSSAHQDCQIFWIECHLRFPALKTLMRYIASSKNKDRIVKWMPYFYSPLKLPEEQPDFIVSSGGNTQFALIGLSRQYGGTSLYSGTPKKYPAELFDILYTVTPFNTPNNIVLPLPPVDINLPSRKSDTPYQKARASGRKIGAVLIGGNGAGYVYDDSDWSNLAQLIQKKHGFEISWLITTSRRTGPQAEAILQNTLTSLSSILKAVWWQRKPDKVMSEYLSECDFIVVTEDSLSMVAEAIYSGRKVYSFRPASPPKLNKNDQLALTQYEENQLITPITSRYTFSISAISSTSTLPDVHSQIATAAFAKLKSSDSVGQKPIRILWWGRFGNYGPDYPRNRTIQNQLQQLGCEIIEFRPSISRLAHWQAHLTGFVGIDVVWVPCFRQRDLLAASKWAQKQAVPLIFDPLISAYDKQVYEKKKFPPDSHKAKKLHRWEQDLFRRADVLIADTQAHADYFIEEFSLSDKQLEVIPVSAEEQLFRPIRKNPPGDKPEFLFFGTFIGLQGTEFIVQSLTHYDGPPIRVTLMGEGPDKDRCIELSKTLKIPTAIELCFEGWIPIAQLADRISRADYCLGIFGRSNKARRVIPNKVYQALACDIPVITLKSDAYPKQLTESSNNALIWLDNLNEREFAQILATNATPDTVKSRGGARELYDKYFSNQVINSRLTGLLDQLTEKTS